MEEREAREGGGGGWDREVRGLAIVIFSGVENGKELEAGVFGMRVGYH